MLTFTTDTKIIDILVTRDLYKVSVEAVVSVVTLVAKANLLKLEMLRVVISKVMD